MPLRGRLPGFRGQGRGEKRTADRKEAGARGHTVLGPLDRGTGGREVLDGKGRGWEDGRCGGFRLCSRVGRGGPWPTAGHVARNPGASRVAERAGGKKPGAIAPRARPGGFSSRAIENNLSAGRGSNHASADSGGRHLAMLR